MAQTDPLGQGRTANTPPTRNELNIALRQNSPKGACSWLANLPTNADAAAIYDVSRALVKSKDMLAKPGTALRWSECATLIKVIKDHPDY